MSHPEFIKWFNLTENKTKIIDFSKNNPSYNLKIWAKKNEYILKKKYDDYKEIYLPRLIYSFYLKEKILQFLECKKKMNISLKIYRGEVNQIKNNNFYKIFPNKFFNEFNINLNNKNLKLKKISLSI